jgi:hypothetical protein
MPFRHGPRWTTWTRTWPNYLARPLCGGRLLHFAPRFVCPYGIWWMPSPRVSSWDQTLASCNCIDLCKCLHDARHGNLVGVASRQHAPFGQNSAESELLKSWSCPTPNCLFYWTWQLASHMIHLSRCQLREIFPSNNAGVLDDLVPA